MYSYLFVVIYFAYVQMLYVPIEVFREIYNPQDTV